MNLRAWITLGPMLAVAALTLWGGERLSRSAMEERIPADRTRLLDFSTALRDELDRLDSLYMGHLNSLGRMVSAESPAPSLQRECERLVGVRSLSVFDHEGKRIMTVTGMKPPVDVITRVPDVEMVDKPGGIVGRTFQLSKSNLPWGDVSGAGWQLQEQGIYRMHSWWADSTRQIAIVVDDAEVQRALAGHLSAWAQNLYTPLAESGALVTVRGPRGEDLFTRTGPSGPAALVIPHRTQLGQWEVQAWDRLSVRTEHDAATLLMACGIAAVVMLAGIWLHLQQHRALKLAEERVSFVNRVSHELGTPLTNILLNLELAGRMSDRRPEETKRRLKLVDEEVRRLSRLVANVLTFSRKERKTLELQPRFFVPDELIAEILDAFGPALERAGIRIEMNSSANRLFHGDPDAFCQIVGNLISNVEKYAVSGRWLGVDTELRDGRLRIRISDAGPGIPPRARSRIFEAFERVSDGVAEGVTGTGLGLAISRDLAARMGGSLRLLMADRGATFELVLPAPENVESFNSNHSAA